MRFVSLALLLVFAPFASAQAGAPDPAFGIDGVVRFAPDGGNGASDVVAVGDGLLVAGAEGGDAVVYRLRADGNLDPSFGDGGIARFDDGGREAARALVARPDGRLVVAVDRPDAATFERGLLVGLTADGALDAAFGINGRTVAAGRGRWTDLALGTDGSVVGLAIDGFGASTSSFAVRVLADGTVDESYGADGVALFFDTSPNPPASASILYGLAVDTAGRAVAVGVFVDDTFPPANQPVVARLDADGVADPTFGTDGVVLPPLGDGAQFVDVAIDATGRVVAAGYAEFVSGLDGAVVRLSDAGALDPTFGDGGVTRVVADPDRTQLTALALSTDGRVVVAGGAGAPASRAIVAARLEADGALDTSFGAAGISRLPTPPDDSEIATSIGLSPNGRVLLTGVRLEPTAGTDRAVVARLLSDTDLDAAPTAADGAVALALAGPNPSAAPRVRLALAQAAAVRVTVHDARGRTLAVLHDGALAAGATELRLGTLAAGIYVVRARSAAGSAALPVAIVP